MIYQWPVIEAIGNHYVRNAVVVVYLASAILPPLPTLSSREYRQPSAVLRAAEEVARSKLDEKYLASQLHFDVLRTQLLAMLSSSPHPLHPFRWKRTMPSSVADLASTTIVNHKLFTIAYRQLSITSPMPLASPMRTSTKADPRSSCPRSSGFQ